MTTWTKSFTRELPKTKAQLREMLAEAVRNTHAETKPPTKAKRDRSEKASLNVSECARTSTGRPAPRGRFCISGHTQKPPRSPSTALPLRFVTRGAPRRAVLERGASALLGRTASKGGECVASVSGQRSPILTMCDWRRCSSSQRCCPKRETGCVDCEELQTVADAQSRCHDHRARRAPSGGHCRK